jgi:uncharacterized RDD family membrane protein YckC
MAQPNDPKKSPLTFQPITEGLGFHPFSDGLPYAPIGKTQNSKAMPSPSANVSQGLGAIAAGMPSFARTNTPRINVPVARPTAQPSQPSQPTGVTAKGGQSIPQRPVHNPSQLHHSPKPVAQGGAVQTAPKPVAVPESLGLDLEPGLGLGYLVKRIFAYLLDTAFNLSLCVGALSIALWKQDLNPELLLNPGIVAVSVLFLAVFNWAITTAQEVAFGTSIGKRIFGLSLEGSTSAVFLRAFFFLPSVCFAGIGLIWSLFDRRKRCWHDMVVDLQPVEIARL